MNEITTISQTFQTSKKSELSEVGMLTTRVVEIWIPVPFFVTGLESPQSNKYGIVNAENKVTD